MDSLENEIAIVEENYAEGEQNELQMNYLELILKNLKLEKLYTTNNE